jgi:hypothetical protein
MLYFGYTLESATLGYGGQDEASSSLAESTFVTASLNHGDFCLYSPARRRGDARNGDKATLVYGLWSEPSYI